MKFSLLENILTTCSDCDGSYFIYKNPTRKELNSKEDSKSNRGFIDTNGDLYVEARWVDEQYRYTADNYSQWIHDDLWRELNKSGILPTWSRNLNWYLVPDFIEMEVLAVQRFENRMEFYLGESYPRSVRENPEFIKVAKKLMGMAKKKNPHLKFIMKDVLLADFKSAPI
jgi:hypothetical protein